eukprot:7366912-Ditylum_brightwellii.AAC.1
MPKISHQQYSSNWKSHTQHKQQSTREDIEKDISLNIDDQNISLEDNSCMDIDNDIGKSVNNDVECKEINDVHDDDDNDDENENEECH